MWFLKNEFQVHKSVKAWAVFSIKKYIFTVLCHSGHHQGHQNLETLSLFVGIFYKKCLSSNARTIKSKWDANRRNTSHSPKCRLVPFCILSSVRCACKHLSMIPVRTILSFSVTNDCQQTPPLPELKHHLVIHRSRKQFAFAWKLFSWWPCQLLPICEF